MNTKTFKTYMITTLVGMIFISGIYTIITKYRFFQSGLSVSSLSTHHLLFAKGHLSFIPYLGFAIIYVILLLLYKPLMNKFSHWS